MIVKKLKSIFERITGLKVYRTLPFGVEPFLDINRGLSGYSMNTFFDIGANVGQTAKEISKWYPDAKIFSIEPFQKTFDELLRNTHDLNVSCHKIAFGAKSENIEVATDQENTRSAMNSLLKKNNVHKDSSTISEKVEVKTLAQFCSEESIQKIDYLKIDTEGYDLQVLKGAAELLEKDAVTLVVVEVGMNPENMFHMPFTEIKDYLESFGYRIFGIYEQIQERQLNAPILRRTNTLFISETIYKSYMKPHFFQDLGKT